MLKNEELPVTKGRNGRLEYKSRLQKQPVFLPRLRTRAQAVKRKAWAGVRVKTKSETGDSLATQALGAWGPERALALRALQNQL